MPPDSNCRAPFILQKRYGSRGYISIVYTDTRYRSPFIYSPYLALKTLQNDDLLLSKTSCPRNHQRPFFLQARPRPLVPQGYFQILSLISGSSCPHSLAISRKSSRSSSFIFFVPVNESRRPGICRGDEILWRRALESARALLAWTSLI